LQHPVPLTLSDHEAAFPSTPPPISIHSQFLMSLVGYASIRFALASFPVHGFIITQKV